MLSDKRNLIYMFDNGKDIVFKGNRNHEGLQYQRFGTSVPKWQY